MNNNKNFEWVVGETPPPLQAHSAAKLKLIDHYLAKYFATVVRAPNMDRLQISLVDGFSGGGAFSAVDGSVAPGTPIILLKAVEAAEKQLNNGRRKKLKIDARFYFVDKAHATTEYLRSELIELGYGGQIGSSIQIINGKFEDHYQKIIADILTKATAGRSLFLLDQFGYSQVPLSIVREIFKLLPRSEISLTFAVDWLIDYLSANASFLTAVAPIEITESQIKKYISQKEVRGGRYLIQRLVMRHLQLMTGAPYFTPFFIRSTEAGRDLWLIHLSKHPAARNVMTSSHWRIQNASIHQGTAGLNMLGFDPHWQDALPLDFEFDGNAEGQITTALLNELPHKIESMDIHGPVTFDAFQMAIANDTAARLDHLEDALMQLHREKAIDILTPSGQAKQASAKLQPTHRLQLSRQLIFPGIRSHLK